MCVSCMRYGAHDLCVAHGLWYVMLRYVMLWYAFSVAVHMVYVSVSCMRCGAHGLCVAHGSFYVRLG